MQVSDFNYELPEELIAQTPIKKKRWIKAYGIR